jgi:ABC transporter substrate binding protein
VLVAIGHLIIRSARDRSGRAPGASRDARPADRTGYRPRRNEYANADQGPRRRERILAHAAKSRLPAVYPWREAASVGGLLSYATNFPDMYRRAASYVDKILKGAKPADLPIEQPTTFELVINLKTAKALGLTIPPSLLQRADQVIE